MPLVSVIVPVYKVEPYLRECVDSILNQTFKDFELILVDDGSPDNCPKICDEYAKKDSRVIVIHKENGGVSSARNAGLDYVFANSNSKYISFVDSDDYVECGYLYKLYRSMKDNNVDFTRMNYKTVSNGVFSDNALSFCSEVLYFENISQQHSFILNYFMTGRIAYSSSLSMFKTEIIRQSSISYINDVNFGEDWLFVLEYLNECKSISLIDEGLYYYRRRSGSCMNLSASIVRLNDMNELSKHFQTSYQENNCYSDYVTLIHYYFIDNQLQLRKNYLNSIKKIKKSIRQITDIRFFMSNNKNVYKLLKHNKNYRNFSFMRKTLILYSCNCNYFLLYARVSIYCIYRHLVDFTKERLNVHASH